MEEIEKEPSRRKRNSSSIDCLARLLSEMSTAERARTVRRACVSHRTMGRLLAGADINAGDFLKLCTVCQIDVMTGEVTPAIIPRGEIVWSQFARGVRALRIMSGDKSLRDFAKDIATSGAMHGETHTSLSFSTLCRAESGKSISARRFLELCALIGAHPTHYCDQRFTGNANCNTLKIQKQAISPANS